MDDAKPGDPVPLGIRGSSDYLPSLEAVRGIAILLVFFFHADGMVHSEPIGRANYSSGGVFVHAGHTGVTLFFVLSAFLLSRPYWAEHAGGPRVSAVHFFQRRALRILPLYWFVVLASSLAYRVRTGGALLTGLPYLFFANTFDGLAKPMPPYSDVWWSLATEAQFYLVLPIIGLLSRSRVGRWTILLAGLLYASIYAHLASSRFDVSISFDLIGRFPVFAMGGAAAWLYLHHGEALRRGFHERAWLRRGGADAILLAVIVAQGLLLREVIHRGFFRAEEGWQAWHLGEALLWTTFVLLILLMPLRSAALLTNRALRLVGRLSYSLYLLHLPILFFALYPIRFSVPETRQGWNAISLSAVAACLALALAASASTYWAIERPFLRSKARVAT